MRRFLAVVRDTLLALRWRRMFWLHMAFNVLAVLIFAGIACSPQGWAIGFGLKEMEDPLLRAGTPWEQTLHCWSLSRLMRFWVTGGGLFLALFATSALLPETLDPGHAALIVPQTRRRSVLLCGRWAGCVLYALGHSAIVIAGLYLAARWRMGVWHHCLWLGLPVCLLLFAPLQAVVSLLGVLTRSATAALLVALLFAGTVWTIDESAAAPDAPDAVVEAEQEQEIGSGLAGDGIRLAATVLPPARDALLWQDHRACPPPPRSYADFFRQWRRTHRGLSAAAANVLAASSPPRGPQPLNDFASMALSSAGFTTVVLLLAARLLRRRDL